MYYANVQQKVHSEEEASIIRGTIVLTCGCQSVFFSPYLSSVYSTDSFKKLPWWHKEILNRLNIWTSPHQWRLGFHHYWVPCFPAAIPEPLRGAHILRRPDSHLAASWLFWTLLHSGFFLIGINTDSGFGFDFSACHALPATPSVDLLNV